MTPKVSAFVGVGQRQHEPNKTIVTGAGQRNVPHNTEARLTKQLRALKETVGLGSIIGTIALIVAIGAPAVKQGSINGAQAAAIDNLAKTQRENDERASKGLSEAMARIEARMEEGFKRAIDLAQQNRTDMASMRATTEGAFVELRQDTKGLWKWSTAIDGRVGLLEAEIRNRPKEK